MIRTARARQESGMRFSVTTGSGHRLVVDDAAGDAGPRPAELLMAAQAGCTAMDVASILRKKRQEATRYEVAVSGESAEDHPRVFTSITVEHRVEGAVEAEALRRSIELSSTRYCPVSAMLSASVRIEHRYRLIDAGGAEAQALVAVTGPDGPRVL